MPVKLPGPTVTATRSSDVAAVAASVQNIPRHHREQCCVALGRLNLAKR